MRYIKMFETYKEEFDDAFKKYKLAQSTYEDDKAKIISKYKSMFDEMIQSLSDKYTTTSRSNTYDFKYTFDITSSDIEEFIKELTSLENRIHIRLPEFSIKYYNKSLDGILTIHSTDIPKLRNQLLHYDKSGKNVNLRIEIIIAPR